MSKRAVLALVLVAATVTGCGTEQAPKTIDREEGRKAAEWYAWHDAKRATDRLVDEASNLPGGPDCRRVIDIFRASGRPPATIDLEVGGTILGCYAEPPVTTMPRESLADGFDLLERASLAAGEPGDVAPGWLVRWFERGVGKALAPQPRLAACWAGVRDKGADPRSCIALRKQLGVP